jgi:hypothetical protein
MLLGYVTRVPKRDIARVCKKGSKIRYCEGMKHVFQKDILLGYVTWVPKEISLGHITWVPREILLGYVTRVPKRDIARVCNMGSKKRYC